MLELISKFSKREKTVLYISIIAILLALLDRAVLHPIIQKMKLFEEEIRMTEYEMSKNIKILQQRQRIENEEKKYASYVSGDLSEEEETAALLKAIENMARSTNVYLVDLKPMGVQVEGIVKKFMINVRCEANMEEIVSFMYLIESADVLMQIGALSMSPLSRKTTVNRCEFLIYKIIVP